MISARSTIRAGVRLLTRKEKNQALILVPLFVLAGFVEMAALGSVAPLAALLVAPGSLDEMRTATKAFAYLGLTDTRDMMIALAGGVMVFLVVAAVFSQLVQFWFRAFCTKFGTRLSNDVYKQVLYAPYIFLLRRNSARLASEIQGDVGNVTTVFVPALFASFYALSLITFGVALIIAFSSWRGLVGVLLIGTFAFITHRVTRRILRSLAAEGRIALQDNISLSTQAFVGIKDVKIKHAEGYFAQELGHVFSRYISTRQKQIFLQQLVPVAFTIIGQLGLIGFAIWLLWDGATQAQIANQIAILLLVFSRLVPAANRLIGAAQNLNQSEPHVEALSHLMADASAMNGKPATATAIPDDWTQLVLSDVSFAYPPSEETTLTNVNIALRRGGRYGIIGPSGAGKSTLVDILLGLLVPQAGTIEIDGALVSLSGESWHRRVGYVPQSTFILDDTVRRNVAFTSFEAEADDQRIRSCLALAGLRSLRGESEIDLGMQLGDRGNQLSGGQRQRIAIARALYAEPEIIVFDEATSGLDKRTEDEVLSTIEALPGTLTLIIVSHDPALIARCDEVVSLNEGRIVSQTENTPSGTETRLSSGEKAF